MVGGEEEIENGEEVVGGRTERTRSVENGENGEEELDDQWRRDERR